jgi:hypothetical protein
MASRVIPIQPIRCRQRIGGSATAESWPRSPRAGLTAEGVLADQHVIACAAVEGRVAGGVVGVETVVAAFAEELIVSALAVDAVGAGSAVDAVVPAVAVEDVAARVSADEIALRAAVDFVVPAPAVEVVAALVAGGDRASLPQSTSSPATVETICRRTP